MEERVFCRETGTYEEDEDVEALDASCSIVATDISQLQVYIVGLVGFVAIQVEKFEIRCRCSVVDNGAFRPPIAPTLLEQAFWLVSRRRIRATQMQFDQR